MPVHSAPLNFKGAGSTVISNALQSLQIARDDFHILALVV